MWTQFMDMHSGGGSKENYDYIYIEAPEAEAIVIFYNRFGHNPHRVTCTCCGSDYSIYEYEELDQATAFERGCDYAYFNKEGNEVPESKAFIIGKGLVDGCIGKYVERPSKKYKFKKYMTLENYKNNTKDNVLCITADQIKPEERIGEVPEEGYVWV